MYLPWIPLISQRSGLPSVFDRLGTQASALPFSFPCPSRCRSFFCFCFFGFFFSFCFFFNDTAPSEIYTLSLHDALPISQGYTAICMNPTDPSALIPAIQEAKEAGIIIGLYSSELPEGFATTEYRDFMCGTNDVLFGEIAAQTLMEAFPDGCNVVEVGGQSGHAAQINRHDGFFNTIDDSINVLDAQDCQEWASEDAMAIMEDFITKHGSDIQAVYCHWDVGLTGCIEAMKASSDIDVANVYTIGVDGCAIGFDQVKEGTQSLCIGQSFTQMTIDAFDCITKIMNGETLETDVVWTEPQIITADTINDYPYPEW